VTRKKWLPDNVTPYRDRHGKTRYRFRKTGLPTHHFRSEPGTPEFMEEYLLAKSALKPEPEPRFEAGTVDAVVAALYKTPRWNAMRPSSKATYQGIIERFRKTNGHRKITSITTQRIDRKLASMSETPAAANNLRKALSRIFKQAIKMGLMKHNPIDATDAYKQQGDGFHTWTEDEIALYEKKWPIGTRERLAMALLLHTALRRSDMVKVGPHHRIGGRLELDHGKNNSETSIPISADLDEAIAPFAETTGTYLQTKWGRPFTANGFGNWFREKVDETGLPKHCSAHGLRKAISRRLAESGATTLQGRAVTGHKTDKEFIKYAEKANRRDMADTAMANLSRKFAKKDTENGGNAT
jgi:site-specific recombinase XerD